MSTAFNPLDPSTYEIRDFSTIVSIMPMRFISEQKPGVTPSYINVEAAEKGDMVLKHISEGNVPIPQLDGKHIDQRLQSFKLAHAICDDYWRHMVGTSDDAHPGVMALPGKLTKEEVILKFKPQYDALVKVQEAWLKSLVAQGDDFWVKYRVHSMITDHHRMAADYFGLKKDWMRPELDTENLPVQLPTKSCIACFSTIDARATVCANCRTSQVSNATIGE